MSTTQLLLNDQLVTISADGPTIRRLNTDDQYLAEYINRNAKAGQFRFLFAHDPSLRRIVVKRLASPPPASPPKPVWCRKGRRSETDQAASLLLHRLRSDKFAAKFDGRSEPKMQLWEEIAREMRSAGFDVDAQKCASKWAKEEGESDEEWRSGGGKRRKRSVDEDVEFFKRFLKRSEETKEERFRDMCALIKRRNELLEEKLRQGREVMGILEKLAGK